MLRIAIYYAHGNRRSMLIARSMQAGAKRLGLKSHLLRSTEYRGHPEHDAAVFYGFAEGLRKVFDDYRQQRRAVYIDLGYWGRRKTTRFDGFHKISVNDRHPTAYFQHRRHTEGRFRQFGLDIAPWRKRGRHILVAGMSAKAARAEGFAPEQFERRIVARLRELTDRPIVYRPKPNWIGARIIPGSQLQRDIALDQALRNCHAVVTHHSNVAVDGLLAGIPCVAVQGAASVLGSCDIENIEDLPMPGGRVQWAADLAWCQWSMDEMANGQAFRYLLDEGLI